MNIKSSTGHRKEFYRLVTLPNNEWHNIISQEYSNYKQKYKPMAASVTYLVYSGVSHPSYNNKYFSVDMSNTYANAFQVHQRPYKTASIHKKWIKKLSYFWYLLLIALPVDIYVHTAQFFFGERGDYFLEGGAFFIPYMILHWQLLLVALMASFVYHYLPKCSWPFYFYILKVNLLMHEYVYRFTLRKLSLCYRIFEFIFFICSIYFLYKLFIILI